jgi:hypothetical protein
MQKNSAVDQALHSKGGQHGGKTKSLPMFEDKPACQREHISAKSVNK